jgi:hypothetical protein
MKWNFWKWLKEQFIVIENEKSINIFKAEYIFPCVDDNCLVRVACTKPCEKIEMDEDKLMTLFLEHNCCPDCGSENFTEGPSGGMSTNVRCEGCKHWFNMSLPISIERIHVSDGRFCN